MINILLAISTAGVGGGENHLLTIAEKLDKSRYNLFFLCPYSGDFSKELSRRGFRTLVLNMQGKFRLGAVFQIKKFIETNEIKIVHTHGARIGFYARIAAKLAGAPVIISTIHISIYKYPVARWIKWLYLFLDNLTLRLCDKIVCVSSALANELKSKASLDHKKIVVIYNGIDLDRFYPPRDTSSLKKEFGMDSQRVIGTISRLVQHKGHKYLLTGIKELVVSFPDIRCLFVGDGPMRLQLEELAGELGISKNCIFTGNRKDIPQILSLLEVLVLPSLSEGFPLVLLEAMAMKRPIVATKIDGVMELVEDGKTGLLVAPQNPSAIAAAVVCLLKDTPMAQKMGEAGKTLVETHFTDRQMIVKLEELYEAVIREKMK